MQRAHITHSQAMAAFSNTYSLALVLADTAPQLSLPYLTYLGTYSHPSSPQKISPKFVMTCGLSCDRFNPSRGLISILE